MLHSKGYFQERLIIGGEALRLCVVCLLYGILLYKQNVEPGKTINSLTFVKCCKSLNRKCY